MYRGGVFLSIGANTECDVSVTITKCMFLKKWKSNIRLGGDGMACRGLKLCAALVAVLALIGHPRGEMPLRADAVNTARDIAARDRVARAYELYERRAVYRRGCSEFVSEVLQIPWRSADSLMGAFPRGIGVWPRYGLDRVAPGDVLGWRSSDSPDGVAHVCIYIGAQDCMFMDVRNPGSRPRKRTGGYGRQELFKSSAY